MKPITPALGIESFPEGTELVIFAEDQPEYLPLPAYSQPDGIVTSCWQPSEEERQHIANGGPIYIDLWTFGMPLQPTRVYTVAAADEETETVWFTSLTV